MFVSDVIANSCIREEYGMYLELKNVRYAYDKQLVLKDINFGIEKGNITGLIGANGAGKTTTILNLTKKLTPQSGEILVDGNNLKDIKISNIKTAYIPDEPVYYEELTLLEHLQFVKALYPKNKIDIDQIIEMLELNEHLYKIPCMLSKGTLQKMMIALALIRDYDLLIADEPFNGLDPKQINIFKNILKNNRSADKAVIISTHLLDIVEDLCDKFVMIHQGKVIAEGSKQNIISQYNLDSKSSLEQVYLNLINRQ